MILCIYDNWYISLPDYLLTNLLISSRLRYNTVDLRALKSWRDGQLNPAHGPETKNNEKIKIKNRVAQPE